MPTVGPAVCMYCDRPIYPTAAGWTHAGGKQHCYAPNGDRRDPRPRLTMVKS